MPENRIDIGKIRSVHPAKREVRVVPRAGFAAAFESLRFLEATPRHGQTVRARIASARRHGDVVIVALTAGFSRDAVAGLKHARVTVPPEDITAPDPFAVDPAEFVGFGVVDGSGTRLGNVVGVMKTAAHGVLEIEHRPGASVLAPLTPEVVTSVDWNARRLTVGDLDAFVVEHDGDDC